MVNSRRIILAEVVAHMGKKVMHIGFNGKARKREVTRKT
jgi:hypothetical protein